MATKRKKKKGPVIFRSEPLSIECKAAFGDIHDIFIKGKNTYDEEMAFTIHLNREFVPGNYRLHIVEVEPNHCVAIVCEETLDPMKIDDLLTNSNTGQNFRCANYLSRYSWMHFRSDGEVRHNVNNHRLFDILGDMYGIDNVDKEHVQMDEEETDYEKNLNYDTFKRFIFFVNGCELELIRQGEIYVRSINNWVSSISKKEEDGMRTLIGFIIDNDRFFIKDKWCYGCVLADSDTEKHFAFVLEDFYTNKAALNKKAVPAVDIVNADYTYPMKCFVPSKPKAKKKTSEVKS